MSIPVSKAFRSLPLKIVLTIPFVLQTVGATAVGYLSFQNGRQSVDVLVENLQLEVHSRIRDRLSSFLAIPPQLNQTNVDAYALGGLDLLNFPATGRYFWKQLQTFDVSYINFASVQGEFIGTGDFGDGKLRIEEVSRNTQGIAYQYSIDADGNRGPLVSQKRYSPYSEAWFTEAMKAGKPIWSNIYNWDGYPQILSISASYPVYNRNANLIGVLGVDFKLTKISDFLRQLKIGRSGKAFVMERSGLLVASSVQEPPFWMVNGIAQRLPALKSHDVDIQNVTQTLQTTWGNLQRVQQSQRLIFNLAGQQKYVQITPWRDSLGLDWLVITVLPESDFMAQIHANTQRSLLLSLLALGLAVSISLVTARWITVTITNLSRAAAEIANGQLSQRVEVKGIRELKTLSQAFNQMATQLQSSFAALATANQALEHRVQERTAALQSANAQVLLLNQQLQADNVRMSAELDVTRRLQQLMLPKAEELAQVPGLDIAGFMEAAHEVGGDYYDVIPSDRQVTIGIGDVTGHGLESGVLMIMAQTAVRTLLAVNEQNPKRFFNALNQVVYQNSQRLSPGKNMTLVLLNYCDQHLYISGQHEDVLVFRANGSVEQVDTLELGMPLGLLEDIQEFVAQVKVQLQPGDGVVLYTDGITEAEGEQRSLYGYDRLIAVVKAHWQSSAQAIRQAVIDDVRSHIAQNPIHDDITLVVLKKLAEPS